MQNKNNFPQNKSNLNQNTSKIPQSQTPSENKNSAPGKSFPESREN
jgi:hypothetical protein